MQCPHCHADGQDGRFCKKCGKPLDQDVSLSLIHISEPTRPY